MAKLIKLVSSRLRRNVIANYISVAWIALIQFLSIPFYLQLLGPKQWGMLAVCMTVYGVLSLLDAGMSQILPREVALRVDDAKRGNALAELLFGFERIYWLIAIFGGVVIIVSAELIATQWINLGDIAVDQAVTALQMLGLQFCFQFPNACYAGLLNGTQSQVKLNKIQVGFITLKHLATLAILFGISATIMAYQVCFLVCAVLETFVTAFFAWSETGKYRSTVSWNTSEMRKVARFTLGLAGAVLVGALTVQLDKIVLSGLVSVTVFGYYVIASQVAIMLLHLVHPITRAIYPYLTKIVKENKSLMGSNEHLLALVSLIVFPISAGLFMFPQEFLTVWLRNEDVALAAGSALALLVSGTLINAYYNVPYLNWLAMGNSKYPLAVNIIGLFLGLILLQPAITSYGITGAAVTWVLINSVGFLLGYFVMLKNRRLALINFIPYLGILLAAFIGFFFTFAFQVSFAERFMYLVLLLLGTIWFSFKRFMNRNRVDV